MKRLFTALFILCVGSTFAQGDGIQFDKSNFEQLKAKAKKENKIIFIDAFTTWCGPCKMMSRDVFTDPQVGAAYNGQFINAKIDMEKGEGRQIAQDYNVRAYPSYLFLNGDGELVHRGLGYIPASMFIELAQVANSDESLLALSQQFKAGNSDPDFLYKYANTLIDVGETEEADAVISAYLSTLDDWSGPDAMGMIAVSPGELGEKRANFLLENADEFEEVMGSEGYVMTLQQLVIKNYMITTQSRNLPDVETMKGHYEAKAAPVADRLTKHYAMLLAQQARVMEDYFSAAVAYYSAYPSNDSGELNSVAWTFFEECEDPAQLKQALEWAKQSVELNTGYANMDTLAWLYHKTGNQKMAEKTAREAIEFAKLTGEDYSGTEQIFE